MREIHLEERAYRYTVGKYNVRIDCPNGKAEVATFAEVTGRNWTDIERDQRSGAFSITPNQIKAYIQENIERKK